MARGTKRQSKTSVLKICIIFMVLFVLICSVILIVKYKFTITSVEVVGSEHYTDDEIADMVMSGKYGHNSIYLYLKYRNKDMDSIPFIEQMDVELKSPQSVKIQVYEKAVAGYVEYLGHYLYFDKDGIIVESSTEQMDGIPFVTGLSFDHVVLHEKLPIEDTDIFKMILNITQLLTKYEISTDRIYFDADQDITLYFGTSRAYLGTSDYIDEKINKLRFILPKMEGKSGVLHMENYTGEGRDFSFSMD